MDESMARPRAELASLDLPGWKSAVSWLAAVLLAVLFAVSGIWKITYPLDWAVRISELKFPENLSLAAALVFGIAETLGAALILGGILVAELLGPTPAAEASVPPGETLQHLT